MTLFLPFRQDIANHQLRSTRPYLVETAVDFEIRWFREQIEQGKLVLDRTSSWFVSALHRVRNAFEAGAGAGTTRPSNTRKMSRTTLISRAFNDGYLKLIFEPPAGVPLVGLAAISGSNAGQTGTSPSSSSLNHTYAACYPETFQFDAYRLITFHNDVTDLTIVYMLLLLFRQLACSPLSEGDASSSRTSHATFVANALNLAQRQLETVKLEIWCLLNDANLCVTSSAGKSESSTPTTSRASAAMSFEGKLFLGSAGGSAKLEDVRWRTAMRDVLLQIAARARAVQVAARDPTRASAPSVASADPPSARTIALLNAWLGTNLRTGSALYKLCQSRLRGVVLAMLVDRLSGQSPSANTNSTAAAQRVRSASPTAAVRKVPGDDTAVEESGKRVRLGDGSAVAPAASGPCVPDGAQADESTSTAADTAAQQKQQQRVTRPLGSAAAAANAPAAPSQLAAERDWEGALSKAGLEPFAAEVRLLGDRVAKVAAFHLRVFRNLYERIDCEFLPSSASSTTSASSASLASAASSAAAAALPSSSSAGSGPATGSSSPKARD